MKRAIFISLLAGSLIAARAATPEQTSATTANATNQQTSQTSAGATATITNSAGQTFTADELAANLKNLKSAIEQTMPMITAISETYSNSASKDKNLTGKVSDFVAGALDKDGKNSSQSSSKLNQVVGALRGLLKTNSNASASSSSTDAATVQHLATLQNQLKPVLPTLDQLGVTSAGGGISNAPPLTPTGR